MNKKRKCRLDSGNENISGFFLCLIFFLCGIFVGVFAARALDAHGAFALRENIIGLIDSISTGSYPNPNFLSVFWLTGRYHLLALFLGFSILGVFALPLLAAVRGFYLSFSIAALIRAFGPAAFPLALSLFGIWSIITIPAFFFVLNQSFSTAAQLGKSLFSEPKVSFPTLYGRKFLQTMALSLFAIILTVILELSFTPTLLLWTSSFLSIY